MARNKKSALLVGASIAVCVLSVISVCAHPGRTDQNGGHWDRKAGTYHFHTGEYAGKGSGGGSSSRAYAPFTPPYEPPTDNPYKQDEPKDGGAKKNVGFWELVFSVLAGGFALLYVACLICELCRFVYSVCRFVYDEFLSRFVSWALKKILPRHKISAFREKIKELRYRKK